MNTFGELDFRETRVLRFGFDKDLLPGEGMTDITLEVETFRGTDPQPELIKSGSVLVDGQDVLQLVVPTLPHVVYHFVCRCKGAVTGLWHVVANDLKVVRK